MQGRWQERWQFYLRTSCPPFLSETERLTQPTTTKSPIRAGEPVLRNRSRSTVLSVSAAVRSCLFQCCLFDGAEATEASPSPSLVRGWISYSGASVARARVSGVGRPLEDGRPVSALTRHSRVRSPMWSRKAGQGGQRMCARGRVTLRPAINNLHRTAMMPYKQSKDATSITSHARGNFGAVGEVENPQIAVVTRP